MSDATDTLDPTDTADAMTTGTADSSQEDYVMEAPSPAEDAGLRPLFAWGVGRRKSSTARVRVTPGSGKVSVNGRELNDFFHNERDRKSVFGPLEASSYGGKIDVFVNADGGGSTGQAGAIVMGLARALVAYDSATDPSLREGGFMTRDSRMKERKKYGQRGARRKFQFSKR